MANKTSKGKKKNAGKKKSPAKSSRTKVKAKAAVKSKPPKKKKGTVKAKAKPAARKPRGRANAGELVSYEPRGLGARSGGQSGDTQGIAARPDVDSESVEQLLEEGQSYEAEVVEGAWKMLLIRTRERCALGKSERMTCPRNIAIRIIERHRLLPACDASNAHRNHLGHPWPVAPRGGARAARDRPYRARGRRRRS